MSQQSEKHMKTTVFPGKSVFPLSNIKIQLCLQWFKRLIFHLYAAAVHVGVGVGWGVGVGHGWGVGAGVGMGMGWGVGVGWGMGMGHGWGVGVLLPFHCVLAIFTGQLLKKSAAVRICAQVTL